MKNAVKKKLYEGKISLGTWITIGNPDVPDLLKQLPFDWFVFDAEHSYFSIETVKNMQMALSDSQACPIVRVGMLDQLLIKRALDIGSQGLIVPLVTRPKMHEGTSAMQCTRRRECAALDREGLQSTGTTSESISELPTTICCSSHR
ncbi:MAG: hypothetical protein JRN52_12695 [Nitrososphaerota archaeon]|nr:hypothetical protein [Nitrososphaerota archaeon]